MLVQSRFSDIHRHSAVASFLPANVILADLGVSSPQFDTPQRGFAFSHTGPLDMRMDPTSGPTARDVLIQLSEPELAAMFRELGEERFSGRIARHIKEALAADRRVLQTTTELADLVRRAVPGRSGRGAGRSSGGKSSRIHPATRVFQALRIYVNAELDELEALLRHIPDWLAPGGRIGIISFHSLEDRRVKYAFRDLAATKSFFIGTKKPIEPTDAEITANPRARSAKLRILHRHPPPPSPQQ